MGEKIGVIGELVLKNVQYEIELNEPIDKVHGGVIHIQNNMFRMEMSQKDFYDIAGAIITANERLLLNKNLL